MRVEHFGISVVEAMAAGAVPLAVGKGGVGEIITPGENGILWDTVADPGRCHSAAHRRPRTTHPPQHGGTRAEQGILPAAVQ